MSLFEINGVSHSYDGRIVVIDGISLSLAISERLLVIGANGAGKSTLAKVAVGLVRPSRGTVRFQGADVTERPVFVRARLGIGYTPAHRSVFPYMTLRENLDVAGMTIARFRGAASSRGYTREAIDEVLETLPGLRPHLSKQAHSLSGGIQRMAEVGRALMGRPKLLILDEPSLGLSAKALGELADGLQNLAAHSCALLVIEQNVPFGASLCDRGLMLAGGTVSVSGSTDELLTSDIVKKTYLGII